MTTDAELAAFLLLLDDAAEDCRQRLRAVKGLVEAADDEER